MSPTPTRRRHPKDETVDFLSERSQALLENGHGRTSLTPSRTLSLNLEQELGAHQPSADEESPTHAPDGIPRWQDQITLRGAVVGAGLGMLFCVITMRLALGPAGIVPSLNVPGGLLSFVVLKGATTAGQRMGLSRGALAPVFAPFGVQENTVVQTMVTACYSIAFSGGFGTYLTAMGYQAYLNTGGAPRDQPGYQPEAVFEPELQRVIPYMLLVSLIGIFTLTSLRNLMILEWRLPFPSGTATGIMLNSFHSRSGEASAMRKMRALLWTSGGSFLFECFKWLYQGADYSCGFAQWPTFGLTALKWTWNFDWNQSYIGSGMICPHVVNWSMLLGALLSWGVMWPLISQKEGDWFPSGLGSHDFKGLFGYKVFLTIAMTMGEGMYMLGRVCATAAFDLWVRARARHRRHRRGGSGGGGPPSPGGACGGGLDGACYAPAPACSAVNVEDEKELDASTHKEGLLEFKETPEERDLRTAVFKADSIPIWISPAGYLAFAALAVGIIPVIYPPVRWYYVLVSLIVAPLLALPNSYGCGLTDWDNCSMFGKLALFAFSAWAGSEHHGVIAGLGICGVILSCTSSAAVLMQDFRTGYITTSSPRAMFISQVIGALMGCFLAPVAFQLIWATGQVGVRGTPYENPFADIYRSMALLGTQGFGSLPRYCALLMGVFFVAALAICGLRDALPRRYAAYVPSPMSMGIPFYIGANNAINFWAGSLVTHFWNWAGPRSAEELSMVVGAGLLVGGGVFAIPSAVLALAGVAPPLCMSFSTSAPAGGA